MPVVSLCASVRADFFKDYPPVAGDAESSGAAIPLGAPPAFADDAPAAGMNGAGGGGGGGDVNPFGSDDGEDAGGDGGGEGSEGSGSGSGSGSEAESAEGGAAECAAVAAWRVEFARGLEERVAAERAGKAEKAEQARETLMKMHRGWEARCQSGKDANADAEKEMLRERDGVLARMSKPGEQPNWSVVPELVDMSGKFKEGARDTSRMRQVLLKLKTY